MAGVTLLVLIGIPGAGKSQLAHALAAKLAWPVVDRDRFARAQFDEAGKAAATRAAFEEAGMRLAKGESCILDGMTFATAAQRAQARQLARAHGAAAILLWLDCPIEVALARVEAQTAHPARDRNPALVRGVAARFEQPEADVVRLDATLPTAELVGRALARLASA